MREIFWALVVLLICLVRGCSSDEKPVTQEVKQYVKVPADELQSLFLKLTPQTTNTEFEDYVKNAKLYLNKENNYSYKVAFRESDARFKRGTSGDALSVSFNKDLHLNIADYFCGETSRHAYIVSGDNPDAPAKYSYTIKSGSYDTKSTPAAIGALSTVVNGW